MWICLVHIVQGKREICAKTLLQKYSVGCSYVIGSWAYQVPYIVLITYSQQTPNPGWESHWCTINLCKLVQFMKASKPHYHVQFVAIFIQGIVIATAQWIKLLLVKIWLWELSAHIEWNCIEELCSLLRSLLLCSNEYGQKPIVLCRCALHRHDAKTAKAYCWLACVDLKQCWG